MVPSEEWNLRDDSVVLSDCALEDTTDAAADDDALVVVVVVAGLCS